MFKFYFKHSACTKTISELTLALCHGLLTPKRNDQANVDNIQYSESLITRISFKISDVFWASIIYSRND